MLLKFVQVPEGRSIRILEEEFCISAESERRLEAFYEMLDVEMVTGAF